MTEESTDTTTATADDPIRETISAYESNPEQYDYLTDTVVAEIVGERFRDHLDGQRVLDAGCGPGVDLAAFETAGLDPVGFDRATPFLRDAADRTDAAGVVTADLRAFPFRDDSFDGVWCCAALLHLPRAAASGVLADAARVLRPGGALFVSVQRGTGRERRTDDQGNDRLFTKFESAELRDLLHETGFSVEHDLGDDDWVTVVATLD